MTLQIKKVGKTYSLPEHVMNDVRTRMYEFTVSDLADEIGVSKSCIYAIRRGTTSWPRGATFFGLLKALDLAFVLIDLRTGEVLA